MKFMGIEIIRYPTLRVDKKAGALALDLESTKQQRTTVEAKVPDSNSTKTILVDLNEDGEIVGIEILGLKKKK